MRICYLNYEWDLEASTGAATQIAATIAGLERLGHEVVRIDRHRKPPGLPSASPHPRFTGWTWEAANHLRSLAGVAREVELLRQARAGAVLILHALRFSGIVAAHRLGLPAILQVNASVPREIRLYRPQFHLASGLSDWIERRTLAAADGVFVVSSVLRDDFALKGIAATVIPNGVDPAQFSPGVADPSFRSRFPGRTLVGFAGSFARFHGLDVLEHAIHAAPPSIHFVLVGSGTGADELRRRCRGRRATFLGRLPHSRVPAVLAAMDILLAPYAAQESFYFSPIKIFEYLACGRAVLAARLGQIAEVIQDDENGVLYDPTSPADLMARLTGLADDPGRRERLGLRARQTVETSYTWDHAARRIHDLLESACARPAGN